MSLLFVIGNLWQIQWVYFISGRTFSPAATFFGWSGRKVLKGVGNTGRNRTCINRISSTLAPTEFWSSFRGTQKNVTATVSSPPGSGRENSFGSPQAVLPTGQNFCRRTQKWPEKILVAEENCGRFCTENWGKGAEKWPEKYLEFCKGQRLRWAKLQIFVTWKQRCPYEIRCRFWTNGP
jgi:hypothetical protein